MSTHPVSPLGHPLLKHPIVPCDVHSPSLQWVHRSSVQLQIVPGGLWLEGMDTANKRKHVEQFLTQSKHHASDAVIITEYVTKTASETGRSERKSFRTEAKWNRGCTVRRLHFKPSPALPNSNSHFILHFRRARQSWVFKVKGLTYSLRCHGSVA